jgi:hypothetical protein
MLQQRPFPIEVTMAPDRVDGLAPPFIYCIFLDEHGVNIQARPASTCLSPKSGGHGGCPNKMKRAINEKVA